MNEATKSGQPQTGRAEFQRLRSSMDRLIGLPEPRRPASLAGLSNCEKAQLLYYERRRRAAAFGEAAADLFQEPAWDILLDLFIAQESGKQITVSSACLAACVPQTTALRWLNALSGRDLLQFEDHAFDRRARLVRLTSSAHSMMVRYLSTI